MLYNYLLAGLEDLHLGGKPRLTEEELLAEIRAELSEKDAQLLDLLLITKDDAAITALLEANEELREESLLSEEDLRTQLLYEQGLRCKNAFLRDWFAFNLDLNNVLTATICRKNGFDVTRAIVGNNEVAQILRKNNASKDFGLAGVLSDYAEMMRLADIANLLDREKHTDALRWNWLEEHTVFHNFEIENVLAYYLQASILHRWDDLTREQGERVFRELIAELKSGIHF